MQKIPTLFERDWSGDRSRVTREVHRGCEWVLAGEGTATRKLDGTCCRVSEDGKLWKRRELRRGEARPVDFEEAGLDEETGKVMGWLPVGDGPEDKFHREAFAEAVDMPTGTYELIGPKVQGNPEHWDKHQLVRHGSLEVPTSARSYDELTVTLPHFDIEGIVWHHPDGRMAKVKLRDFGIKRPINIA